MTKICVEFLQCELVQHNIPFHIFYKYTDNKAGQNSTIMYLKHKLVPFIPGYAKHQRCTNLSMNVVKLKLKSVSYILQRLSFEQKKAQSSIAYQRVR